MQAPDSSLLQVNKNDSFHPLPLQKGLTLPSDFTEGVWYSFTKLNGYSSTNVDASLVIAT